MSHTPPDWATSQIALEEPQDTSTQAPPPAYQSGCYNDPVEPSPHPSPTSNATMLSQESADIFYNLEMVDMKISDIKQLAQALSELGSDLPIRKLQIFQEHKTVELGRPSPPDLNCLSLTGVPLGPFLQLTTLTEFTYEGALDLPIDTFAGLLMNNPRLKRAKVVGGFQFWGLRQTRSATPILKKLQHFAISSAEAEDIKALIQRIPVKSTEDAMLEITFNGDVSGPGLEIIHSVIKKMYFEDKEPLTTVSCEQGPLLINFIKPKGPTITLSVGDPAYTPFALGKIPETLHEPSQISLYSNRIRTLSLQMFNRKGEFNPYLFPALEELSILEDTNLSGTLSRLFLSPKSCPALRTIKFLKCTGYPSILQRLEPFVFSRTKLSLACHKDESEKPSSKHTRSKHTCSERTCSKCTCSEQIGNQRIYSGCLRSEHNDSERSYSERLDSERVLRKPTWICSECTCIPCAHSARINSGCVSGNHTCGKRTCSEDTCSEDTCSEYIWSEGTWSERVRSKYIGSERTDSECFPSKQTGSESTCSESTYIPCAPCARGSPRTDSECVMEKHTCGKRIHSQHTRSKHTRSKSTYNEDVYKGVRCLWDGVVIAEPKDEWVALPMRTTPADGSRGASDPTQRSRSSQLVNDPRGITNHPPSQVRILHIPQESTSRSPKMLEKQEPDNILPPPAYNQGDCSGSSTLLVRPPFPSHNEKMSSLRVRSPRESVDIYYNQNQDMASMEISTIKQLEEAWLHLPTNIRELKISWKPKTELDLSLPSTLTHLFLDGVTLDPFLCKVTTLTEFTCQGLFTQPVDILLEFLENTPLLRRLVLHMKFQVSELRKSNRHSVVDLRDLQHLAIGSSGQVEDIGFIKALIQLIPIRSTNEAKLEITFDKPPVPQLQTMFLSINENYFEDQKFPTTMYFLHGRRIELIRESGPAVIMINDSLPSQSSPFTFKHIPKFLDRAESPLSFQSIRSLHLKMSHLEGKFDPSLFPALEELFIEGDANLSLTLSKLFSSPESFSKLRTIKFLECPPLQPFFSKMEAKMEAFVAKHRNITCWWNGAIMSRLASDDGRTRRKFF